MKQKCRCCRTKANLTRQQKVGLKYYDELLDRMPREEAAEIEATVSAFLFPSIITFTKKCAKKKTHSV